MNIRQLQYAVALSKTLNFSQEAHNQGITQPALSKQILALEKELGVQLFNRDNSPMTLTPAGEQFIRQAQELIYKEEQLLRTMEQFRTGEAGRLNIGISPFRNLCLMPDIVRKLQEKYPNIQICLHEPISDLLRKDTEDGKYDFSIVNLPVDETLLDVVLMEKEQLVLAVPNTMCATLSYDPDTPLPQIELTDCAHIPFVTAKPTQEMRRYFDLVCAKAGFHPKIAVEVTGLTSAWSMAQAGIGAALLPLQFVGNESFGQNVTLFTIKDNTFTRQPAIVMPRGRELSEPAKYAIDLLTGKV